MGMSSGAETQMPPALVSEIQDVIRGIVRAKLRVTLNPSDSRAENQDALEVASQAWLEILRRLDSERSDALQDIRNYASVVTYHVCAEHLRTKYSARFRLQHKIRYLLTHRKQFALWDAAGNAVCGLAEWSDGKRELADSSRIAEARNSPAEIDGAEATGAPEDIEPRELEKVLRSVFLYLRGAAPFQSVVGIVASILGLSSFAAVDELPEQAVTGPSAEARAASLELLRALWSEVVILDLEWRRALLLNPPRGMDLEVFTANGIASIDAIGAAVALVAEHYGQLWTLLNVDSRTRSKVNTLATDAARFQFLWAWLPVADAIIARLLRCENQRVINLRRLAKDRLAERVGPRLKITRPR